MRIDVALFVIGEKPVAQFLVIVKALSGMNPAETLFRAIHGRRVS
jgi:hypothetical protein